MADVTYEVLVGGDATGPLVVLEQPLSFWGGFDPVSGEVIDAGHPQLSQSLTGKVVAMPTGRGSSSSSSVLAEAMRRGSAPAAFILTTSDPILVIGSLVGRHLYGTSCPVLVGPTPGDPPVEVAIVGGTVSVADNHPPDKVG